MSASIEEHFSPLEDPRIDRNKRHELMDIIILVVCAVTAGASGWEAIEEFGKEKLDWLRKFAPFAHGVPSHDCIANVVSRLSPKGFQACFRKQIIAQGGDYVLGLKGNQSTLQESVEDFFEVAMGGDFAGVEYDYTEEVDKDHGRLEVRRYWITEDLSALPDTS